MSAHDLSRRLKMAAGLLQGHRCRMTVDVPSRADLPRLGRRITMVDEPTDRQPAWTAYDFVTEDLGTVTVIVRTAERAATPAEIRKERREADEYGDGAALEDLPELESRPEPASLPPSPPRALLPPARYSLANRAAFAEECERRRRVALSVPVGEIVLTVAEVRELDGIPERQNGRIVSYLFPSLAAAARVRGEQP